MNEHILVVDDKVNIRMVLTGILENSSYSVTEAENGKSAFVFHRKICS